MQRPKPVHDHIKNMSVPVRKPCFSITNQSRKMQTLTQVSETIVRNIAPTLTGIKKKEAELVAINHINWFLEDIFKLLDNIKRTSLNDQDREKRLMELETKFGIPANELV